ncbi:MAG: dipeptidyl aminopeptidase/acylaminoacyl peptidase [Porticoccaceae bacterium]|jgi:dipeptidyl aminopeptidase/acylaminoacyl peptidase
MNKIRIQIIFFIAFSSVLAIKTYGQETLKTSNVESVLYLGSDKCQPLIVGFGGSEGGNAWTSDYWKKTRNQFIEKGYAFLAIGYFGANGTPKLLEKIAIEDVYNAIKKATNNKKVNGKKIAIVGGSRGADLALLVGSYYKDIDCVIGLVASNAVFPGNTNHFTTSTWTFEGKELPFVPVNEEAVPFLMKRDLRGTFETMLKDTIAEKRALIKVEKIKGPILLISATEDEVAPTTPMSDKIIARLKEQKFKYHNEHIAIEGGHSEPLKHFDLVFDFLDKYFPIE